MKESIDYRTGKSLMGEWCKTCRLKIEAEAQGRELTKTECDEFCDRTVPPGMRRADMI